MPNLSRHVLWLFGVIVGLAMSQALTAVVPSLFHPSNPPEHGKGNLWDVPQEGARLLIFLTMIVRFYVGAASFFEHEHGNDASLRFPRRIPEADFLVGVVHFIFFFVWSLTLTDHSAIWLVNITPFFALLIVILSYDAVWFMVCRKTDTRHRVGKWAVINMLTAFVCGVVYISVYFSARALVHKYGWPIGPVELAEISVVLPVLYFSAKDFVEIIRGEEIYLRGLIESLRRFLSSLESTRNRIEPP